MTKKVVVDGSPFARLKVQPWAEDAAVVGSSPAGTTANVTAGHVGWEFADSRSRSVQVVLTLEPT